MVKANQKIQFNWLWESHAGIVIISIIITIMAVSVMALLVGISPLSLFIALFEGGLVGRYALSSTIRGIVPLALLGLAVYLPFRAGFFNIGAGGQLEIGALVAVVVAININISPILGIPLSLLAAALVGIVAVLVPLLLKLYRGANEVTTALMIHFATLYFVNAMITGPLKEPGAWYGTTERIPDQYALPSMSIGGISIHLGVLLFILITLLMYLVMSKTVFGFRLSVAGYKESVAEAVGIPVKKTIIIASLIGAAIGGLAGGIQILGEIFRVAEGWSQDWIFVGIPIAFLAGRSPLAIIPIAFLFAVLETGARYMQISTGIPSSVIYVFQYMPVLIFVILNARRGRFSL